MSDLILDSAVFLCLFILPGYVFLSVFGSIIPTKLTTEKYTFIFFSVMNLMLLFWILPDMDKIGIGKYNDAYDILRIPLFSFVSPILEAFAIGYLYKGINSKNLAKRINIKLPFVTFIPSAWDYMFYDTEYKFVLITLHNGNMIAGLIGENSFISSDVGERDLYIERTYRIEESESGVKWLDNENEGVYIKAGEISTIEFFAYKEE